MDERSTPTAFSVEVRDAQLSYAGRVLFDDLSILLEAGVMTCLLGPSGVGKTTLLRVIAGLAPEGARSTLRCGDGKPLQRRVAYMAQQDLLLPWLSVLRNVALGSRLRGTPPDLAKAQAFLEAVGLGEHIHDSPQSLSGGMRQRVAVARTLMENRPVILMDEPFSALDAITRHRLQALAAEILRGRTILLVTHDPLEALRLGGRILIMTGRPARLAEAVMPEGDAPRDPADPTILRLHARLLEQLSEADRKAA